MRKGCFLIVLGIGIVCGGIQGIYTIVTNPKPQEYTVEKYLQEKPSAKWLRLTDGNLDLLHLNYTSLFGVGHISEIYVPLRPAGASSKEEVRILVATKDPALLQLAEDMRGVKTKEDLARFVHAHLHELAAQRTVQGLVRFGLDAEDSKRRKLQNLNDNLAQDFVVVAEGERPDYSLPLILVLGGIGLVVFLRLKKRGASPNPPGSQPPPLPPSSLPPPLPVVR